MLSSLHLSLGEREQALQTLDSGLEKTSTTIPLLLAKASLLENSGAADRALEIFNKILGIDGKNVAAHYGKGVLLHGQGRQDEAVQSYLKALETDPGHVPTLNNLAYLYLEEGKDYGRGLEYAIRAFRLAPNEPAVMDTLGYALYRNQRSEDARKLLEGAARGLPNNPTVLYHLALVYKDLGQTVQAVQTLESALGKSDFPEQAQAQELLSRLTQAQ